MPLYCTMVNACERIGSYPIRSYGPQAWGRNRILLRKRRDDKLRQKSLSRLGGPALLDVMTSRMELVTPPHIEAAPVFGMALYSAKAVLAGRAGDVWELVTKNL
jgi:hypothetical protein